MSRLMVACESCGHRYDVDDGCPHGGDLCPACTDTCPECRDEQRARHEDETADAMRKEGRDGTR